MRQITAISSFHTIPADHPHRGSIAVHINTETSNEPNTGGAA